MKSFHTKADCKCKTEFPVNFQARPGFGYLEIEACCPRCGSALEIQVKGGLFRDQCETRTKLIKHTQKLLDILGIEE